MEKTKGILDVEINSFMVNLPEMLEKHENMWTIFKGRDSLGFWYDERDAINEGYEKYGNEPFLLRKVSKEYQIFGKYGEPVFMGMPSIRGDDGTIITLI